MMCRIVAGVRVAKEVLNFLLVSCFSILESPLKVRPGGLVLLHIIRSGSGVACLQQELDVPGHPRLVVWETHRSVL